MKFNLTIECADANELARVVALLSGTTALTPAVAAAPQFTAAPAPAAFQPQPVAAAPVGNGDVDSKGMPWDGRIHSETKAQNKNGTWRYRRGVDDATAAAVETELRARAPIAVQQPQQPDFTQQPAAAVFAPAAFQPQPVAAAPAPSPEQVFGAPQFAAQQPAAPVFAPQPVAAAPLDPNDQRGEMPAFLQRQPEPAPVVQQPVAAAPVGPAPVPTTLNFQQLMAAISQGLRDKKIDNVWLGQLVAHFQLPSIPALANSHASLMPQVVEALRTAGVV